MINNQIKIYPRASGKTTDILELFVTNKSMNVYKQNQNKSMNVYKQNQDIEVLFITNNKNMADNIKCRVRESYSHLKRSFIDMLFCDIITVDEFLNELRYRGCPRDRHIMLFIDEYFSFSNSTQKELYKFVFYGPTQRKVNVKAVGTSNMLYKRELIQLAKIIRGHPKLVETIKPEVMADLQSNYMYNFITHESFEVQSLYDDRLKCMESKEEFETQYLGKFYQD